MEDCQGPTVACHLEPGRLGKADYPLLNLDPEVGRKIITRGDLERVGPTAGKETIWARALGSTPQTPARPACGPYVEVPANHKVMCSYEMFLFLITQE